MNQEREDPEVWLQRLVDEMARAERAVVDSSDADYERESKNLIRLQREVEKLEQELGYGAGYRDQGEATDE